MRTLPGYQKKKKGISSEWPETRFLPSDLVTDDSGDLVNRASEPWPDPGTPEVVVALRPANRPLPPSAIWLVLRRTAFLILTPKY